MEIITGAGAADAETEAPAPAVTLVDARQSLGPAQLDDLFPEGAAFRRSVRTFIVLLALAALIAAFGLYQDSVASIIGAMVVAPLGGAIMAFAASLVTGRLRWQGIAFLQVALGALLVVAVGWVIAWILPDPLTLTPSLEARTSPGLLDLGVALAAGAAGAYVTVRRTGGDALPGVAIAVSLVPPLATVGICLELGRPLDAMGALLLFLTNFAAIVVVACIVFMLGGALPSREMLRERSRLRNGFVLAVLALLLLAVPLGWNSLQTVISNDRARTAGPIVDAWIGARDLQVSDWTVDGTTIHLQLAGTEPPADAAPLAAELAKAFKAKVNVEVVYVPATRQQVTGTP